MFSWEPPFWRLSFGLYRIFSGELFYDCVMVASKNTPYQYPSQFTDQSSVRKSCPEFGGFASAGLIC
jgi:hypothetical protein